jgi:hypothetical protein
MVQFDESELSLSLFLRTQECLHGLLQGSHCFHCYHSRNHHLFRIQNAWFRPKSVPRQWEGKLSHLTGGMRVDTANNYILFSIDNIDNGRLRGVGKINCYSTCTERCQCGHCLEIGSQTRSGYRRYQGKLLHTPELKGRAY